MTTVPFKPAHPAIRIGEDGKPWLAGSRCSACDAVYAGGRATCASCGGRDTLAPIRLAERGTLYNYTIVHRSYPGVPTPFIAAIVDLEGGGTLRGTLLDVVPDPATLAYDLPVEIQFRETGQVSKEGAPFLAYYFRAAKGASA